MAFFGHFQPGGVVAADHHFRKKDLETHKAQCKVQLICGFKHPTFHSFFVFF